MTDPTYPLFPVLAFFGFIVVFLPLPWNLRAWNSGTCFFMLWTGLACLNEFVNAVVWAGNTFNPAPVWCDITTRLMIGASVGIPASSLCINRRLYTIVHAQTASVNRPQNKKSIIIIIDSLICVVFPLIVVALSYVVQDHRFNILEGVGCTPAIYNTLPAYFLLSWWPIVIGSVSALYCALSLVYFARRRMQFHELMNSNKCNLTSGRYFRLMALATTEIMLTIPITTFTIYLNLTAGPLKPWISLTDTHTDISRVDQFPAAVWRTNRQFVIGQELTRWQSPACACIFFAYFGMSKEARRHYMEYTNALARKLKLSRLLPTTSTQSLPQFVLATPPTYPVARIQRLSFEILDKPHASRPSNPTIDTTVGVISPIATFSQYTLAPVASSFVSSIRESTITLGDFESLCDAPLSPSSVSPTIISR